MKFSGNQIFKFLLTLSFVFSFSLNYGQNRLYDKAYRLFLEKNYKKSWQLCQKGIRKYHDFDKFYLLCAKISYENHQFDQTTVYLNKYFMLSHDPSALSEIGYIYFDQKLYDSAAFYFRKSLKIKPSPQIQRMLNTAQFRISAYKHPVPFKPQKLPKTINTKFDEYFPELSPDNQLFFTRRTTDENIFRSTKTRDSWTKAQKLPKNINTQAQEGACTISTDGKTLIFTRCITGIGCDLYITHKTGSGWTNPEKLPYPINTQYWESQPCLANNGRTLLFVSNRPQGKGDMDIWKIDYVNGRWTNLQNLGDSINTPGKEMSPFLHFDGKTLYFASNYHPGLGGFDLFVSRLKHGHWTKPQNLGYPINTEKDDTRLVVDVTGKTAYFASAINGNQDIYSFELYPAIRPSKTFYIAAKVFDAQTLKPLKAQISIYNLSEDSLIFQKHTQNFKITIAIGQYGLFAYHKGYLPYSKNFDVCDTIDSTTIHLTILLKPIAQNQITVLRNIFFDFNSYTLKPQSYIELEKLVYFLKDNPTITIEIAGHTDSIGTHQYNMKLSQNRALAVKNFLVKHGINPGRLIARGYGDTKPVAPNTTEKGRKLNRRVEIKIIKL